MKRIASLTIVAVVLLAHVYLAFAQPETSIEILVRKFDGLEGSGRKRGDIVVVKELPHVGWGREEGPPNYVIVKIDDISAKEFEQYNIRHGKLSDSDLQENPETVRSRYRFNLDTLPSAVAGKITVRRTPAIANVIDRRVEILSSR